MPAKPDAEIKSLLDPIADLLSTARIKLDQLGRGVENFQYNTESIQNTINMLSKRVQEQEVFLKHYVASSLADRGKLFYR